MKNLYYTLAIVFGMGMIASCGDATDEATAEVAPTEETQAADAEESNDSESEAVVEAEEK